MKKNGKLSKCLSLILCTAMVVTMMPESLAGVFGTVARVKAATTLYIDDGAGKQLHEGTASGTGWSYDESTGVLTLHGFNGSYIETAQDLTVKLQGENTLTMVESAGNHYGINADGHTLTFEKTNSSVTDKLTVKADYTNNEALLIRGDCILNGGTLVLDGKSPGGVLGFHDSSLTVKNDANVSVTLDGSTHGCSGISTLWEDESATGSVNISVTGGDGAAVTNAYLSGSGNITFTATGDEMYATDGALRLNKKAGSVSLGGEVRLETNISLFAIDEKASWNCSQKGFYWKKVASKKRYALADLAGNVIKDARIDFGTSVNFGVGRTEYTIGGLKVGASYDSLYAEDSGALWLAPAVYGGARPYRFSLKEGSSLPAGLEIDSTQGSISGTPTEATAAGSAVIVVTDASDPANTKEIKVNYEAVEVAVTTTGVTVAPATVELTAGETAQITATVLPADASTPDVDFSSADLSVAAVKQDTKTPTDNITTVEIKGVEGGKTTVTATTRQGSWTATVNVTVKEATPEAKVGSDENGLYLYYVKPLKTYSVNGVPYTVDGAGRIYLPSDLYNKTISIIKTNDDPNLNSEAQQLDTNTLKLYPTVNDFNLPTLAAEGYLYNGEAYTVAAPVAKVSGMGTVTVYYEGINGTFSGKSTEAPVNAGSYAVTFNVAEGSDYMSTFGLSVGTLTIRKAQWNKTQTQAQILVGSADSINLKDYIAPGGTLGTVLVTEGENALDGTPTITGSTLFYGTKAGSPGDAVAKVTIPVSGATNYEDYDINVVLTTTQHIHVTEPVGANAPTCTEAGNSAHYKCKVCGMLFSDENGTQQISQEDVLLDALGHDWDEASYVWAADNSTVTATRICKHDSTHTETETVDTAVSGETAGCDTAGTAVYTAKFVNPYFAEQEKTVEVAALGHDWYAPTYVWSEDNSQVTATHICKRDNTHKETEIADAVLKSTTATCETAGTSTYEAVFKNTAFATQTKDVETVLGHDWGEWTVVTPATVTTPGEEQRVCKRDATHVESRVIPILHVHALTLTEGTAATCETAGNTAYYTCSECGKYFSDTEGKTEIELSQTVVAALGHDWGEWTVVTPATEDAPGEEQRVCKRDETHIEKRAIPALNHPHVMIHHDRVEATATTPGNIEYWECSECHRYFSDSEGKKEISLESTVIPAGSKTPDPTPENPLKDGEEYISEADEAVYVVPVMTDKEVPVSVTVDGQAVALNLEYDYLNAVTYTGGKILPEEVLKVELPLDEVVSQVAFNEGVSLTAQDVFKVTYVKSNNKEVSRKKKATFYAKLAINKGVNKQMPKAEYKKLKKLVTQSNKALKKNKCEFTINPKPITDCAPELVAKFNKDGTVKVAKKTGLLSGVKGVWVTLAKRTKLAKSAYTLDVPVTAADGSVTVKVTGKKNYTGTAVVEVKK